MKPTRIAPVSQITPVTAVSAPGLNASAARTAALKAIASLAKSAQQKEARLDQLKAQLQQLKAEAETAAAQQLNPHQTIQQWESRIQALKSDCETQRKHQKAAVAELKQHAGPREKLERQLTRLERQLEAWDAQQATLHLEHTPRLHTDLNAGVVFRERHASVLESLSGKAALHSALESRIQEQETHCKEQHKRITVLQKQIQAIQQSVRNRNLAAPKSAFASTLSKDDIDFAEHPIPTLRQWALDFRLPSLAVNATEHNQELRFAECKELFMPQGSALMREETKKGIAAPEYRALVLLLSVTKASGYAQPFIERINRQKAVRSHATPPPEAQVKQEVLAAVQALQQRIDQDYGALVEALNSSRNTVRVGENYIKIKRADMPAFFHELQDLKFFLAENIYKIASQCAEEIMSAEARAPEEPLHHSARTVEALQAHLAAEKATYRAMRRELRALQDEKAALENEAHSAPGAEGSSRPPSVFLPQSKPDLAAQRQTLLAAIDQISAERPALLQAVAAATDRLAAAAQALRDNQAQIAVMQKTLQQLKAHKKKARPEQSVSPAAVTQQIQQLTAELQADFKALKEHPSVRLLFSDAARERVFKRHVPRSPQHRGARAERDDNFIPATASYDSAARFLTAVLEVYAAAQRRFPSIWGAENRPDFTALAQRYDGGVEDRICQHSTIVGSAVRRGAPDLVSSTVSSYSFCYVQDSQGERIALDHLFPKIQYARP